MGAEMVYTNGIKTGDAAEIRGSPVIVSREV